MAADIEIRVVRVGKSFDLQLFPDPTLIVIDGREVPVRGLLVQEQRQSLTTALDAAIELGFGLREIVERAQASAARPLKAGFEIGPAEIEVTDPACPEGPIS